MPWEKNVWAQIVLGRHFGMAGAAPSVSLVSGEAAGTCRFLLTRIILQKECSTNKQNGHRCTCLRDARLTLLPPRLLVKALGCSSPTHYLARLPRPSRRREAQEGRLKTSCLRGDTTSLTLSIVNIVYLPHLLSKGHADGAAPAPRRPSPPAAPDARQQESRPSSDHQ